MPWPIGWGFIIFRGHCNQLKDELMAEQPETVCVKMLPVNHLINSISGPDARQSTDSGKYNRPKQKKTLVPKGR